MTLPPTMPQLRGGHQLLPVSLATVITSILGPFQTGTGPYSQLAWPWNSRCPFSLPPSCQRVCHLQTMDWMIGGPLQYYVRLFAPDDSSRWDLQLCLPSDLEWRCHRRGTHGHIHCLQGVFYQSRLDIHIRHLHSSHYFGDIETGQA
jgi:hypothetical protein